MSDNMTSRFSCWLKASLAFVVVSLGSIVMLFVAVLTAFQLRRLYAETLAGAIGRMVLRIWGIDVVVHDFDPAPARQRVYISNHTSTLDLFVLISLRLPDTRFFMSGFLRKIIPLGLIGYLIGIIWTQPQAFPERRTQIFQRAERLLRRTGESVYLSPEGERVADGRVGHFNKGAFHLATGLKAQIVPFYIFIPPEIDPGMGVCARPGTVQVYFKPAIETTGWRLEDLLENKDTVRQQFVAWHHEYHG
jgi:1-acyl-sn-glycerol-3-phosphate acyltransferase